MIRLPARLPLRGWFLLALLPTMGGLSILFSLDTYFGLQRLITRAFDDKLAALATLAASFIDAPAHHALAAPLPLAGLVQRPGDPRGWLADRTTGDVWTVDLATGARLAPLGRLPAPLDGFAPDPSALADPRRWLVLDGAAGVVARATLDSPDLETLLRLPGPVSAWTTDPAAAVAWAAGPDLVRLDLRARTTTRLAPLPFPLRSLVHDPREHRLHGLDATGATLLTLDPATGDVLHQVPLAYAAADFPDVLDQAPAVRLVALGWDAARGELLGAHHSLVSLDPATGTVTAGDRPAGFGRAQDPRYLHYVHTLRTFQQRTGTTYFCTQTINDHGLITYVLDAGIGENFSPLLSLDQAPAAAAAPLAALMAGEGSLHLTAIEEWGQWGRIKSGYAPLRDPLTGETVALTGVDVEVGTIQAQGDRALVITTAAALLLLLVTGLSSLRTAGRLALPLHALRQAALRAAGGDYRQHVEIERPAELRETAALFSAATLRIDTHIREAGARAAAQREARRRADLAAALDSPATAAGHHPALALAWGAGPGPAPCAGIVAEPAGGLLWLAPPATVAPAVPAALARALLRRPGTAPAALAPGDDDVTAWFFLPPAGAPQPLLDSPQPAWSEFTHAAGRFVVHCTPPWPRPPAPDLPAPDAATLCATLRALAPPGQFLLVRDTA